MYNYITHMYLIAVSFCITEYKVYNKIYYFVPINIPSIIKSNYIEGINQFKVEGGLPAGLTIDANTGDISGTATVKIDNTNFKIIFDASGTAGYCDLTISSINTLLIILNSWICRKRFICNLLQSNTT